MTRTVLIFEDDELIRKLLRERFEEFGDRVLEAENGRDAQIILEHFKVDLVIADLIMPLIDGMEFLKTMCTDWPSLPFIPITAPSNQLYLEVAERLFRNS